MTILTSEFFQQRDDRNTQIGQICHQWAHLELLIANAIWRLLGVDDETGRLITGGLDIVPRLNKAILLAEHLNAPLILKRALRQTRVAVQDGLDERRNQAIHGVRFIDSASPLNSELFLMHRGKLAGKPRPVTNADLAKLAQDIAAAQKPLLRVLRRISGAPAARPAKLIARNAARKAAPNSPAARS